jgi:hypothetical protein
MAEKLLVSARLSLFDDLATFGEVRKTTAAAESASNNFNQDFCGGLDNRAHLPLACGLTGSDGR